MRRFALIATTAVLAACQPPAPEDGADVPAVPAANTITEPAPEPATPAPSQAAIDYRSEMRLVGNEPFWGARITAGEIKFMRMDHPDVTVTNAGPTLNGDVAVWNARDLTIRLEPDDCSDGMSDNRYPYAATVTVGAEVLRGCAARADQWPRGEG